MTDEMSERSFRKSSFCANATCVEVATGGEAVVIRDGKDPDGLVYGFPVESWRAFVRGAKAGEFDVDRSSDG